MWCRECIRIVYRGSIPPLLVVPTVYRRLESFLPGVVQEGWALARSTLAGFKWVRAESASTANQTRPTEYEAADDNFTSHRFRAEKATELDDKNRARLSESIDTKGIQRGKVSRLDIGR